MPKLPSTQRYLDISEIKNDCLVLKNGTLCAMLLAPSINFALKSEDEQKAVIQNYVRFLNVLDAPMQIVIQSRPFNIKPYLTHLEELKKAQRNELLKSQMGDYSDFIKELVQLGEIMTRRFYIVIPYNPLGDKKRGFFSRISDLFRAATTVKLKAARFEKYREALFRRVDNITAGLKSMGLKAAPLDTQSLIELFYNIYNPAESETQKLPDIKDLRVEK
ncbi:TraC family protein [Patescibacteria group bacterium]|nr:TraC family protein [Patescibacteria group bacterium]